MSGYREASDGKTSPQALGSDMRPRTTDVDTILEGLQGTERKGVSPPAARGTLGENSEDTSWRPVLGVPQEDVQIGKSTLNVSRAIPLAGGLDTPNT